MLVIGCHCLTGPHHKHSPSATISLTSGPPDFTAPVIDVAPIWMAIPTLPAAPHLSTTVALSPSWQSLSPIFYPRALIGDPPLDLQQQGLLWKGHHSHLILSPHPSTTMGPQSLLAKLRLIFQSRVLTGVPPLDL